jgi:glutamate synthase (ferredoxin)
MMRACHLNTTVGIATQDPELRKTSKELRHIINFMYLLPKNCEKSWHNFRIVRRNGGSITKLNVNKAIKHYKASGLDLSTIL